MIKNNFLNFPNFSFLLILILFFVFISYISDKDLKKTDFQASVAPVVPLAYFPEKQVQNEVISIEPISQIEEKENKIPEVLRGIYVSSWVAGTPQTINRIINLIDTTSANAIIIDIKDATGRVSYIPKDPYLASLGVGTNRIRNLENLIKTLKEKNIYVIGRISVFQDPYYVNLFPNVAYKDTRTGNIWLDNKNLAWLRNDSKQVWDYTVAIARDAVNQGFDEINLDYVRFPSDGPISYLDKTGMEKSRREVVKEFFQYINQELREKSKIIVSADLFGLTMSARDDLGIGQVLEDIVPYVDYIAPMVYPSHFANGTYGVQNPAQNPGIIINKSMSEGIKRLELMGEDKNKLRPWLQDFNLGAVYTPEMVKAQIDASQNLGLKSWMLWDPKNIYTKSAL